MSTITNEKTQEKQPLCDAHEYEAYRSFPSRWFLKARQYRCRLCGHKLTTHEVTTATLNGLLEAAGDPRRITAGTAAAKTTQASQEYRYAAQTTAMVPRATPEPGDSDHADSVLVRPRRRSRNSRRDTTRLSQCGEQEPQGEPKR